MGQHKGGFVLAIQIAANRSTKPILRLANIEPFAANGAITGVFQFGTYDMSRLGFADSEQPGVHILIDILAEYRDVFSSGGRNGRETFRLSKIIELVDGEAAKLPVSH